MLKLKNKMMGLAISALMLGATAETTNLISQPLSVSAASESVGEEFTGVINIFNPFFNYPKIYDGYNAPTYIKCRSGLNMRTGPGTNYRKISAIPYGTWVITTHLSSNGWAMVRYGNKTGWIYLNNGKYAEVYLD